MAVTKIIIPFLKQDVATKIAFNSIVKPLLASIVKVIPGAKMQVVSLMISEKQHQCGRRFPANNRNW
jgi:hypothetical protein